MNRSRYINRPVDKVDRAIISALTQNARMTVRDLAGRIGLSSPSVTERIHKLEDSGAIAGYTIAVDPDAFGLGIAAYIRLRALPGEVARLKQMLVDSPEIVEADHVTGEDCFIARVLVGSVRDLEALVDRFVPFAATETAIVQSCPVQRRLPKM
jgi:Lrp/AsnC family transcriptional regulator, leucine-responsive regulatory protein